jgi:uncharacterized repeat protein (TIGR03803 family)
MEIFMKGCGFFSVLLKCGTSFLAVGVALSGLALASAFPCSAQTTITVLHDFAGGKSGAVPAIVTPSQGRDGRLYGTTAEGGPTNAGTVFKMATSGEYRQFFTLGTVDGTYTQGGLTLGIDGNYYGTANGGGSADDGVLFKISPAGNYRVLHSFLGGKDGKYPYAAPIQASDGNFYGTTGGGSPGSIQPTVYRYKPDGTFSTIYILTTDLGQTIEEPVIQGTDGNLYGFAYGADDECGTIFKLSLNGTLLFSYTFPGAPGGCLATGLTQATDGNFYGATFEGGTAGLGTIFKLDQAGNVTILYSLMAAGDGQNPSALSEATDGKLYGTTSAGGAFGFGTLFSVTTSGTYTVLASLTSETQDAFAAPLQATSGLFYGTAEAGGLYGYGSVYSFDVGLGPFVTFVLPVGKVGLAAQILGQGFTGTTSVAFNGVPATSFKVGSDTFLTAIVPTGATTGPVVVTTPTATLTSNKSFQVLP